MIVDWNSPGFMSVELIQGVRRRALAQAVRLIILSALAGEHDVVAGLESRRRRLHRQAVLSRVKSSRGSRVLRAHRSEEQDPSLQLR